MLFSGSAWWYIVWSLIHCTCNCIHLDIYILFHILRHLTYGTSHSIKLVHVFHIYVEERNTKKKKKPLKYGFLAISRPNRFRSFVPKDDWTNNSVSVSEEYIIALVGACDHTSPIWWISYILVSKIINSSIVGIYLQTARSNQTWFSRAAPGVVAEVLSTARCTTVWWP